MISCLRWNLDSRMDMFLISAVPNSHGIPIYLAFLRFIFVSNGSLALKPGYRGCGMMLWSSGADRRILAIVPKEVVWLDGFSGFSVSEKFCFWF
jgi:hypothetical protein